MSDFSPLTIIRVVLDKHRQFGQSNINRIEYTPQHPLQNILGTNGSGKSTLLTELFPWPSHKDNFEKGGSKIFECTFNDHHYLLTSKYNGGSGKHYFVKDHGENLNPGCTLAVQKELIFSEFGLNKERLDLLAGVRSKVRFTNQSTARRREWLTQMSPINLDYAFDILGKVKQAKSDFDGHVKHMSQRLARETQTVPSDNDQQHLTKQITRLTKQLNELFKVSQASVEGSVNAEDVEQKLEQFYRRSHRLLNTYVELPPELNVQSHEEALAVVQQLEQQRYATQTLLDNENARYQQLLAQAPARDQVMTDDEIAELRRQKNIVQIELNTRELPTPSIFPLVSLANQAEPNALLTEMFNEWVTLATEFPNNEDGRFQPSVAETKQQALNEQQAAFQSLDKRQNLVVQRLQRLKSCETISCPKCDHGFRPGVSPQEIEKLTQEQTTNAEKLTLLENQITELKTYLEDMNNYRGYIQRFRSLIRQYPTFKPVWDVCIDQKIMFKAPSQYLNAMVEWRNAMEMMIERDQQQNELDLLSHKLRYVEAVDKVSLGQLKDQQAHCEARIVELTQQLEDQQKKVEVYKNAITKMRAHIQELGDLFGEFKHIVDAGKKGIEYYYQKAVDNEIRTLQLELAQAQETLSKIEVQEGILKDLESQLTQASTEHKDTQVLLKALSPTDGLIGRYMRGFMEAVVKFMNHVINQVWTYPLVILPSKVDKEEMDYRFPLDVNNGSVTPADIEGGSTAQQDIINFAFQLLARKFLKLEHFPLYLDELGASFDEVHRNQLIHFIGQLIESGQIHQIFFVSHYVATYGAFTTADVSVLDPSNITVPVHYNQCLTIT